MEDNIIISLPKKDIYFDFLKFSPDEQAKILELGIKTYTLLNRTQSCWNNIEVEKLLRNEKEQREKIIKNHQEEKNNCPNKFVKVKKTTIMMKFNFFKKNAMI